MFKTADNLVRVGGAGVKLSIGGIEGLKPGGGRGGGYKTNDGG